VPAYRVGLIFSAEQYFSIMFDGLGHGPKLKGYKNRIIFSE
jgi:hypothetical protein